MSTADFYSSGLGNVGSYLVSGRPWISGSVLSSDPNHWIRFTFGNVTKSITVRTNEAVDLRVHFAPFTSSYGYTYAASTDDNYVTLAGPGELKLDFKCKEIFISAPSAGGTESFEIYAELTHIPANRMYSLDGVDGVSSWVLKIFIA